LSIWFCLSSSSWDSKSLSRINCFSIFLLCSRKSSSIWVTFYGLCKILLNISKGQNIWQFSHIIISLAWRVSQLWHFQFLSLSKISLNLIGSPFYFSSSSISLLVVLSSCSILS
jgi:hypothetical protein